jgi:hypothetical protein
MKWSIHFLAVAWLTSSTLMAGAATWVADYWPMNEGDVRYFSGAGGASYLQFVQDFDESAQFTMYIYRQESAGEEYDGYGRSSYGYSAAGDTLFNYGQKGPIGAFLHFEPPWALLTDSLLAKGGITSSRFYAGVPFVTNIAVLATVKVRSVGTVTVPAGTFYDCRSASFTIKVAGRSTAVGGQAMILAPGFGPIKLGVANIRGQFIGWQSLTDGTVGGADLRELAAHIPPRILVQPRGKAVRQGARVRMVVRAVGPPPLTYQWFLNDAPVLDANQSAYVLPHVGTENAGDYTVAVSNASGSATSTNVAVTLR